MRIEVGDIQEGLSSLELECKAEEIGVEMEGATFISPITASLKLFKQEYTVFVKAEVSVTIESECARCLSPVQQQLVGTFEVQYQSLSKAPQRLVDAIGIGYYSEDYIDISDDVRESLILEFPARILCSEDCKGLCSRCGQDLNKGKCDCRLETEEVQPSKFAEYIKTLKIKNKLGV